MRRHFQKIIDMRTGIVFHASNHVIRNKQEAIHLRDLYLGEIRWLRYLFQFPKAREIVRARRAARVALAGKKKFTGPQGSYYV